jgi:hypothetical protein
MIPEIGHYALILALCVSVVLGMSQPVKPGVDSITVVIDREIP